MEQSLGVVGRQVLLGGGAAKDRLGQAGGARGSSARSPAPVLARVDSSSWRTIPNPKFRSSSPPRAASTVISDRPARRRTSSSRRVFPIPAGPSISDSLPRPVHASRSSPSSSASSCSRSSRPGAFGQAEKTLRLTLRAPPVGQGITGGHSDTNPSTRRKGLRNDHTRDHR